LIFGCHNMGDVVTGIILEVGQYIPFFAAKANCPDGGNCCSRAQP
jgi:hypothetical protein